MQRWLKLRDAFPKSTDEYAQQLERALQLRRADLDATWETLEEGCAANNERMIKFALSPRTDGEGVVKLNVGGSNVNVCWHLLAEAEGFKDTVLFALLEGVWGNERIPRDSDDCSVLDESPVCIKYIIHMLRAAGSGRSSSGAAGLPDSAAHSAVAVDEVPCLIYTAHVMGLPWCVPTHPKYAKMNGGSTILEPFEIAPLGATIREWVGGSTEEMTLIYRATRDGFDTKSFKPACNEDTTSHVISLIRVSSGKVSEDDDSVVGGYSDLAWGTGVKSEQTIAKETFVFMLKDGSATRKNPNKPTKWNPNPEHVGDCWVMNEHVGACVGHGDLISYLGKGTVRTGRSKFDVEEGSPFLALSGKKVVEIEVYRYSKPAPPTAIAPSITEPGGNILTRADSLDTRAFGEMIATSLTEERVVLDRAVKEMEAADARVSAAVGALTTVYGPSVAAGEQDAVVELNVRGVRMTTLRSTLQACPRSALAAMFNEDRWPPTEKDKDEHGRRLVDCNATCFSKILDVLRMRKRASWGRSVAAGKQEGGEKGRGVGVILAGGVVIKETDAETFGETVNMYFPGCEGFIMDLVQPV